MFFITRIFSKKTVVRLNFFLFLMTSLPCMATPWLAPDDAYLRSDLQVLADAGLIHTPISTYPIRWSRIDGELQNINVSQLSPSLQQSYAHVTYALQSALMDRGNKRFKAAYSKSPRNDASFAAPMTQKWQGESSYEMTGSSYAFRVAANYQRSPDKFGREKNDYSLDDSYLALTAGNLSLSAGTIQRWWGPTWVYNLAWGHTRQTIPGVDLAYDAYNWPIVGSWHIESFIGSDKTINSNRKQWSSRLEFSPASWLTFGFGYQKWFKKSGVMGYVAGTYQSLSHQQDQYNGDVRLSLPDFELGSSTVTQSVYAQAASLVNDQSFGSAVLGWQSQFNILNQYIRLIAEVKHLTSDAKQQWQDNLSNRTAMVALHHNLAVNNGDVGQAKTVKLLWVTPTDWELTLQGQRYDDSNNQTKNKLTGAINLPIANSRLMFGSDYQPDATGSEDQWNYWGVWDLRF